MITFTAILAVILPQLSSSSGLVITFYAYPANIPGQTGTANFDYVYNFGPFASLHHWQSPPAGPSQYAVDADTITGSAGNNVIFGELGDNTITGGSGSDNIDGGNGFSTLDGGGGMNFIVDDRSRDTYVFGGGNDIPASSLNTTTGSPLLAVTWQSVIGTGARLRHLHLRPSGGRFHLARRHHHSGRTRRSLFIHLFRPGQLNPHGA